MRIEQVIHRSEQSRIELTVNDEISLIDYVDRSGVFYLTHSEVPYEMRGKGVGKVLVTKTLEYLQEQGIKYVPVCSYIKRVAVDLDIEN